MLELLENLAPQFEKAFRKEVAMVELTAFSLQLSQRAALAMTNRYLYVMRKGFFKVSVKKIPLSQITGAKVKRGELIITTVNDEPVVIGEIAEQKKSLACQAAARIESQV